MKYTYRDFVTRKPKFTRGTFSNWTRGGPLNAWYATFKRGRSVLFIPEYCLTTETRDNIPPQPKSGSGIRYNAEGHRFVNAVHDFDNCEACKGA